ncbi:MAG: flagellar hook-associated protein FlgK [Pseudomonadota bacterium]|nr:flagellar hook-associated protein FlgK [Pseudomonadota bacterium]
MGASTLMALGVRAMNASYAALQTTGHNIANANVQGYSQQSVGLATSQGQYTGAGFFGRGVDVTTVSRAHNEFLTRESASASSLSAMDAARLTQLQRMETVFKPGEGGLGQATTSLFDALSDLASHPADAASRQVVLARASDLASRLSDAGASLDNAQSNVDAQLQGSVDDINQLARGIAGINQHIAALRGLGQPANDLLDQRDQLISKLSSQVQVTRIDAEDGTVGIFVGGGQRLVLGTEAAELRRVPDSTDPKRSAIGVVDGGVVRTLDENSLGGGTVAGLLRFQNQDLVAGRNQLGRLALTVGTAVNNQQASGLDLNGQPGARLFGLGLSQGIPNANNARDAGGSPIGSATLTIVDASAVQASDYDLRPDTSTPGNWTLTRLSDGVARSVASGDVVDGMRIDLANIQAGDRFLLQPTARVANGMTTLLADPRDLAAASPLIAAVPPANAGSASVAGLQVTASPLPTPGARAELRFDSVDASGNFSLSYQLFDAGGAVVGGASGLPWRPGDAIGGINGFTLQLAGVPRVGDTVSVDPTPANALSSNNGNALALAALRDAPLSQGRNAIDTWALAISDVGTRVQSARTSADISASTAQQAEQTLSSQTGVNLDEEAARLIQYQQSYQAAAKVLQVAQAVFDTLLQTAAR